jgi:hypothetical protein
MGIPALRGSTREEYGLGIVGYEMISSRCSTVSPYRVENNGLLKVFLWS